MPTEPAQKEGYRELLRLAREYAKRFNHPVPRPELESKSSSALIALIKGALELGRAVPGWLEYRPIPGTVESRLYDSIDPTRSDSSSENASA